MSGLTSPCLEFWPTLFVATHKSDEVRWRANEPSVACSGWWAISYRRMKRSAAEHTRGGPFNFWLPETFWPVVGSKKSIFTLSEGSYANWVANEKKGVDWCLPLFVEFIVLVAISCPQTGGRLTPRPSFWGRRVLFIKWTACKCKQHKKDHFKSSMTAN